MNLFTIVMMTIFKYIVFSFFLLYKPMINVLLLTRDLRIIDNRALLSILEQNNDRPIVVIFIFNPKQVLSDETRYLFKDKKSLSNKYFSQSCFDFMISCLYDLNIQLKNKLNVFFGNPVDIIKKIHMHKKIRYLATSLDCTPFANKRNKDIEDICNKLNISYKITTDEFTLLPLGGIKNNSNTPYQVFTPFYKKVLTLSIPLPSKQVALNNFIKLDISENLPNNKFNIRPRLEGLKILKDMTDGKFNNYIKDRDYPAKNATTHLSKYLKFGCISIRECYHIMNKDLARELIWREFYAQLLYSYPSLLSDGNGLPKRYNLKLWKPFNAKLFNLWKNGNTGFPIIDAAMRCLNQTNWMHNRLRMVVASFLVKDCFIDWHKGEQYFATKLIDYDPASNNGGWRWTAGVGADAQVYYRIFNPWTQSMKYDPDCEFIKKWIPELKNVDNKHIHKWNKYCNNYDIKYPNPCLNHDETRIEALQLYKQVTKESK